MPWNHPPFWAIQFLSISQPNRSIFSGVSWFVVWLWWILFQPHFVGSRTWLDDMDGHDMVRQWKSKEHLEISLNLLQYPVFSFWKLLPPLDTPWLTFLPRGSSHSPLLYTFLWSQNFTNPFFLQLLNWRGLFVDETVCAGCLKCASTAPGTFEVDPRTRQFGVGKHRVVHIIFETKRRSRLLAYFEMILMIVAMDNPIISQTNHHSSII